MEVYFMGKGIFDQQIKPKFTSDQDSSLMRPENKQTTVAQLDKKEDFKSIEEQTAEMIMKTNAVSKSLLNESKEQKAIDQINSSVGIDQTKENEKELADIDSISEEDLKLAESMIFQNYAEKTVPIPNFKNHTITICTTSPEEIDIVDEMLFDMVKQKENKETNSVDISDALVRSARNMYNLALGYKGMDEKDISHDNSCQSLNIIKKGIGKLSQYENEGNIKNFSEMKDSIKKAIRQRANVIKKSPTPVIDFISQSKYDFDQKMFNVMNSKNLLPK
jgi:hypothetical protein